MPDRNWHGALAADLGLPAPKVVAQSDEEARPGYATRSATELVDTKGALAAKAALLAKLLKASKVTVAYTGAGISTAAGIGDYASKAKGSIAPHMSGAQQPSVNRLDLVPTYSHQFLAALEARGGLQHWLQQNHDRLAQKAGFPQAKLNEIHGAWGDDKNQVKMMDDTLREDLREWMAHYAQTATLTLALGTSLCGMTSDCVAEETARRGGLVIINLQETGLDDSAALRFWGTLDDVLRLVAKELKMRVPNAAASTRGADWVHRHTRCKYSTPKRKAADPL